MEGSLVRIVSVLHDKKNLRGEGWQWLHNNVNVLNATEVYILKGLKLYILCHTCLAAIKNQQEKQT